ncbi:hypothetical protein KGP36_04000 [Patescibacteria group bacterium]|nr:hypothetical protein [Patescibacteria group bacterium]
MKDTKPKLTTLKGAKTTTMRHGDFTVTITRKGDDFQWDTPDKIDPSLIMGALEWCKHKIMHEYFSPKIEP